MIKQSSLTGGAPSPKPYQPGFFSSLPRGVFAPTNTLGRSSTLPRQPIDQQPVADKRSSDSDSVVSRAWYPTPSCDGRPHSSGTLHELLMAARLSLTKISALDLSKAQLTLDDSMCLGETVRLSIALQTLKFEGASRLSEILPAIIGAGESQCLQILYLGSTRVSIEDTAITLASEALGNCKTLRVLSIDGWNFRLENSSTLLSVRNFFNITTVRELSMNNIRIQVNIAKTDNICLESYQFRSAVVVLKMAGSQVYTI